MHVRVFTLKFNPVLDGFDDSELQAFILDRDVLFVTNHFFEKDGVPYLVLIVHYHPKPMEPNVKDPEKYARDESWRDLLTEADWPLFNSLRGWRKERAKQDGLPPYIICTNRMLAQIVHDRTQSLEPLGLTFTLKISARSLLRSGLKQRLYFEDFVGLLRDRGPGL